MADNDFPSPGCEFTDADIHDLSQDMQALLPYTALLGKWQHWQPKFDEARLQEVFPNWQSQLELKNVKQYIKAILDICHLLLRTQPDALNPKNRLLINRREIVPQIQYGPELKVNYTDLEIAEQISCRCNIPVIWAEIVWLGFVGFYDNALHLIADKFSYIHVLAGLQLQLKA